MKPRCRIHIWLACFVSLFLSFTLSACDVSVNVHLTPSDDKGSALPESAGEIRLPPAMEPENLDFKLPDFELEDAWSFGWGAYERSYSSETSYEAVQEYVESLKSEGFTCHHVSKDDRNSYLLYRGNSTILIFKSAYSCVLRYHVTVSPVENGDASNAFPAPSFDTVLTQLGDETAIYAFEVTPDELYKTTGARLFEVVYREPKTWASYSGFDLLRTRLVLVGENGLLLLHDLNPGPMYFSDIDGNGNTELLYVSGGYTSGISSEIINVLEVQDGVPVAKATQMVTFKSLAFAINEDGELYLSGTSLWGDIGELGKKVNYSFRVEDGNLILQPIEE